MYAPCVWTVECLTQVHECLLRPATFGTWKSWSWAHRGPCSWPPSFKISWRQDYDLLKSGHVWISSPCRVLTLWLKADLATDRTRERIENKSLWEDGKLWVFSCLPQLYILRGCGKKNWWKSMMSPPWKLTPLRILQWDRKHALPISQYCQSKYISSSTLLLTRIFGDNWS